MQIIDLFSCLKPQVYNPSSTMAHSGVSVSDCNLFRNSYTTAVLALVDRLARDQNVASLSHFGILRDELAGLDFILQ
jgi:hypothetical protein